MESFGGGGGVRCRAGPVLLGQVRPGTRVAEVGALRKGVRGPLLAWQSWLPTSCVGNNNSCSSNTLVTAYIGSTMSMLSYT